MRWAFIFSWLFVSVFAQQPQEEDSVDELMSLPMHDRDRRRAHGFGEIRRVEVANGRVYALGRMGAKIPNYDSLRQIVHMRLIEWDGSRWRPVLIPNAHAVSTATVDNTLYIANQSARGAQVFQRVRGGWQPVGPLLPVHATNLMAAGTNLFVSTSKAPILLWRWSGSAWTNFGSFEMAGPGTVKFSSIAEIGSTTFVAGRFAKASGIPAINIAAKSSTWAALGTGPTIGGQSGIQELASLRGNLVALAASANDPARQTIWTWNGQSWTPLNSPFRYLHDVRAFQDGLLMIGSKIGGAARFDKFLLRYDGVTLSEVASPITFTTSSAVGNLLLNANAIAVAGTNIYLGGSITVNEPNRLPFVATLRGSTWVPLSGVSASFRKRIHP